MRWLELDGVVNGRDVGGLALAEGGAVAPGRLLRSDNLQDLSEADVDRLVEDLRLRTVIDLRTGAERRLEGPTPLDRDGRVEVLHLSVHPETGGQTDVDAETVLPGWGEAGMADEPDEHPVVRSYLGYLQHRPDAVVAAVRAIAGTDGAVLVHCAAGKDRTGVVVALALDAAGVDREAVVADYLATAERIEAIIDRLASTPTYAGEVRSQDPRSHAPRPGTMERVLELLDERHGGAAGWLRAHGLTEDELAALRARLG
ncbi:tyrosine-protein phosphatase [Conexibacter sp. SYSU D00693]|uniref:tyrosine-protein phosphatase n=1 Tax=Conexibacter sp. SYSU D00693 TaxID=2812560 RepID=UPI00196B43E7|nr:tyrosine-protein phosphatase [Conexibacter sp. SYSU D00693]